MAKPSKTVFFENLDGLRAIAAISVIFYHMSLWYKFPSDQIYIYLKQVFTFGRVGGNLGVIFFFVLSGFLITYLLLLEQENHSKINVPKFYLRRVLRIWPLYYLTIFIGFAIYPLFIWIGGGDYIEKGNLFLYLIFGVNFDHIYLGGSTNGILGVHWSVAIEEQFYLIWPLLFLFFAKSRYFIYILLALVISSELFTDFADLWEMKYYHLFSNIKYLAFGAIVSVICFNKNDQVVATLSKIPKWLSFLIYLISMTLLFTQVYSTKLFPDFKFVFNLIAMAFFGYVLAEQNFSKNSFFKIGKFKLLGWLGKISYGLYLMHMIAIYIVIALFPKNETFLFPKFILTIGITVLISYLSHRYYESFFIRLKSKFST